MTDIGEKIKSIRSASGLSQKGFGARLDVTEAKIQNIEAGKQRVDHRFLGALRICFGVDINDLLNFDGQIDTIDVDSGFGADFVGVRRLDISASAGSGAILGDETAIKKYAFSKFWLNQRGLNPANLHVISVVGDSMEPKLRSGDLILLDGSQTKVADGLTYVLRVGDELLIKYIQRSGIDKITLHSENPRYESREIDLPIDSHHEVVVIGRVVASMHEW